MRVLMLGWEFPPHISGGLGTACFGLTEGLAHHGVEVTFIVPRAHGDEDSRFVRILGANQVPVMHTVESPRRAPSPRGVARAAASSLETSTGMPEVLTREPAWSAIAALAAERPEYAHLAETLRILSIDSPLLPYLTEERYLDRVRLLEEVEEEETPLDQPAERPAQRFWKRIARLQRAEALRAVESLARTLAALPELSAGDDAVSAVDRALTTGHTLEFTGVYGPDLLGEVARYALVVGEAARTERFDVIHAHDWMTYPAGLVAARISKKPLVVHLHASEYDRSGEHVNERIRGIEQLGFDAADRVICVSHYTAGIAHSRYGVSWDKLRVVHNAVTHRELMEGTHAAKTIPEPIVLFLGRVTFQKGPDYFLEAAARVIKIEPHVKFVMSGAGDMLPRMVERSARLGLARHVHFTGFLRGDDVERMYAMADIYVMPSVSEPFGISPLEAMALDVPVIVSRQSGVAEILRNALKVDFWDVQEIANKILALLRYPALVEQLTSEGRDEVRRVRWELRAEAVREVYKELVR